ncbi:hypothetical protein TNCV_2593721 [Trichonephila clavipes]|nr:hypothetical protein TNCV_2593721 [Trichonephila clavipes]
MLANVAKIVARAAKYDANLALSLRSRLVPNESYYSSRRGSDRFPRDWFVALNPSRVNSFHLGIPPPFNVVVRTGGIPVQMSSSSLDHGSKLRGLSPKALEFLNSVS